MGPGIFWSKFEAEVEIVTMYHLHSSQANSHTRTLLYMGDMWPLEVMVQQNCVCVCVCVYMLIGSWGNYYTCTIICFSLWIILSARVMKKIIQEKLFHLSFSHDESLE